MPLRNSIVILGLLALCAPGALTQGRPPVGRVEAIVSVVSGMASTKDRLRHDDIIADMDGSTLELGRWKCALKAGRCAFDGVAAGVHAASALLKSSIPGVRYRLVGTGGGSLVRVTAGPGGTMLVQPQNSQRLIYKIERVSAEEAEENEEPPPPPYVGGKPDTSLHIEVWVRVRDEREGGSHDRLAQNGELDGSILRLGSSECRITGSQCVFREVRPGKLRLDGELRDRKTEHQTARYRIDPKMKPLDISIDPWTHGPRARGWKKEVVVTIEKIIDSR